MRAAAPPRSERRVIAVMAQPSRAARRTAAITRA